MTLLQDSEKQGKMDILKIESYSDTFGKGKKRTKPKLGNYDLEALMTKVNEDHNEYVENQSGDTNRHDKQIKIDAATGFEKFEQKIGHDHEEIFLKGTSKRIWRELYKVVDSSDVIIQVLDARDPMGTRCLKLEKDLKKNHPHKHMILLLNKCDLIPNWATRRWCEILRKDKPTLAFHASVTNPFGKAALIQLLRQFAQLMKDKKHMQVGLIGYPNVGKSSVINTLKKKEVCKAAPIPGETKCWQYIALTKKIYAIDCPGIVPITKADFGNDTAKILKGVVRAEKIEAPSAYIDEVLDRVKHKYLIQKYNLPKDTTFLDGEDFLGILARKMGKLRKGGEPDIETAARIVLFDWQRGRIPFFTAPPGAEAEQDLELEDVEFEDEDEEEDLTADVLKGSNRIQASDVVASLKSAAAELPSPSASPESSTDNKSVKTEDFGKDNEDNENEDNEDSDDENEDSKSFEMPDTSNLQDFGTLKCSMGFDDKDLDLKGNKKSKNKLAGAKLSTAEYKKARRNQRREKDLAMNSDESDVDLDDDMSPANKKNSKKNEDSEDESEEEKVVKNKKKIIKKKNLKRKQPETEETTEDNSKSNKSSKKKTTTKSTANGSAQKKRKIDANAEREKTGLGAQKPNTEGAAGNGAVNWDNLSEFM